MAAASSPGARLGAFALSSALFLSLLSTQGCRVERVAGFEGAWAFWSNGLPGVERYLLVERARSDYLVFLVDAAHGELEGTGRGVVKGGKLEASMGGGVFLDLELNGKTELRMAMRKPAQAEDLTLVFYRADSPAAGRGVP
jgi:hypothetical protein